METKIERLVRCATNNANKALTARTIGRECLLYKRADRKFEKAHDHWAGRVKIMFESTSSFIDKDLGKCVVTTRMEDSGDVSIKIRHEVGIQHGTPESHLDIPKGLLSTIHNAIRRMYNIERTRAGLPEVYDAYGDEVIDADSNDDV
jgi:hypothetical protein